MTGSENDPGRLVTKLFGAMLIAAGALLAGLCGLCTVTVLGITAFSGGGGMDALAGISGLAMAIGGIPFAIGVGLFILGRRLWRGPAA